MICQFAYSLTRPKIEDIIAFFMKSGQFTNLQCELPTFLFFMHYEIVS